MKKKLISLLLCSALVASFVSGCGSQEKENTENGSSDSGNDMVTVEFALSSVYDFSDVDMVEEEINKILGEKYGIQTNITFINSGSWVQQSNLLLTGSEVDVIAVSMTPLATFVKNGQLLPLDDYYNASEAMQSVWTNGEIEGTKMDGKLYSITNFRNFANKYNLHMSEDIVNELNIDVNEIHDFEDIDRILYQVAEAYPDIYPMVGQNLNFLVNGWTWDGLGDDSMIGVIADCGQGTKVENLFETEDFKEFTSWTHKWYQDGLIMSDILSNTERGENLVLADKAFCHLNNDTITAPKEGIVYAEIVPAWTAANSYASLSYGINANSEHPDEAWKLMEAIYTDSEIATLLVDGIEGVHYVKNDDGSISYPEGKDANNITYGGAAQYFTFPNASITPSLQANGATFFEDLKEFNDSALKSSAIGFAFDFEPVADEYAACVNIMNKYYYALLDGTVDPETTIEQANKELETAGIDKVIQEKQSQLDEFMANK